MNPVDYTVKSLKEGSIRFAAEQPENGKTTRVTCSSGVLTCSVLPVKVMSLCSSTCWGRSTVSVAKTGSRGGVKPEEVDWQDNGLEGKLDLVVTLDFRLSSTCLYSDIILPTATGYEKKTT